MRHRLAVLLPLYLLLHTACYGAAFLLRFDFNLPSRASTVLWTTLPVVLLLKAVAATVVSEWQRSFKYVTLRDVGLASLSVGSVAAVLWLSNLVALGLFPAEVARIGGTIPRSVIVIDAALSLLAIGVVRSAWRFTQEVLLPAVQRQADQPAEDTLIWRADGEEIGILRTLQSTRCPYRVVGFIDDQPAGSRQPVAGIPLYSTQQGWQALADRQGVRHLLIPATLPGRVVRQLVASCTTAGIRSHIIPTVSELVEGRYRLAPRAVTISDLLRREPARLNMSEISKFICNRRVLVTGAAGSIGSELCRQILSFGPECLVLLDQSARNCSRGPAMHGWNASSPMSAMRRPSTPRCRRIARRSFFTRRLTNTYR